MSSRLLAYRPEMEMPMPAAVLPLQHEDELALAAQLLEVRQPAQFDAFLAQLLGATRAGRQLRGTPLARPLRQLLSRVLAPLMPLHGAAQEHKRRAARIFGMELEGLSPEDKEFELARRMVQLICTVNAELARQGGAAGGAPQEKVASALQQVARILAPGLLKHAAQASRPSAPSHQSLSTALPLSHSRERIMHDIDRTTMEYNQEATGFEAEQFEFGQGEWSGEGGGNALFSEAEEMELANELLSVSNEAELEQFLGNFLRKAASVAGSVIKSPIGQAVGGVLKGVAKKAIPLAGGAIGGYFGGPLGAKIGSGLASAAGNALGLEAESGSGEEREFEGAKQFVRLAADTVNRATQARGGDPRTVAQQAASAAARQFAPGLLARQAGQLAVQNGGPGRQGQGGRAASGRWARQGQKIVLYGV